LVDRVKSNVPGKCTTVIVVNWAKIGRSSQCLIADADTSKFWISLYKANGNIWYIIHFYMYKIGEKDEFSMKFAIWAPKKRQNGKNQLVRQIRKKWWRTIKKIPFCNSALKQLKIEIIQFFEVVAVSTSP
jgi:hypothetical protein